jgi:hypothetical protein
MEVTALSVSFDQVIRSKFINAVADYDFAIAHLIPRIGELSAQRVLQNQKFYDRLAKDIVNGCIMPPLTLAVIADANTCGNTIQECCEYIKSNVDKLFILDGIQRLNTLSRVDKSGSEFNRSQSIFLNVLVCPSIDHLLYRMITLNNGQKPMTARHQIEVIADNAYDFESLPLAIQSEKPAPGQKRRRGAFKKVDIIKSYLAFLASSINIDNEKIIQEKMDELIASKIMDANILEGSIEFDDVVDEVQRLVTDERNRIWFSNQNNLIAFSATARSSYEFVRDKSPKEFWETLESFESAFSSLEVSKIKLGTARRKSVAHFFENYDSLQDAEFHDILDTISMVI